MKTTSLQERIQKYLKGTCTPEEKLDVETWYQSAENDVDILEFLSDEETEMLRTILFKNIRRKISERSAGTGKRRSMWGRYAAAAMLVLGIALAWVGIFSDRQAHVAADGKQGEAVVFTNNDKNIRRAVLPDGSTAWVHPASSLSYPSRFREDERAVTMTGEVFFEVTSDSLRPFVVYSGGVRTRVLGTSFSIRSYGSDPYTKISVVTGKVSVSRIEDTLSENDTPGEYLPAGIVLVPDESAVYSIAEQSFRKESEHENPEMAIWKKSSISFDNIPVREVLKTLNAVYRVKIVVAEKELEEYMLRADFTGMNLPDALEILGHSFGLTYEIDDDLITLKKSGRETM